MPLSRVVYNSYKSSKREGNFFSKIQKVNDLDKLVERSKFIIFQARSSFPYLLFPDKITICLNRVTISYGNPLASGECPMMVDTIIGARVLHGLYFSSLDIDTFGIPKPGPLRHLKNSDARTARRYILALIECRKNNIDLTGYRIKEIREKLLEIGRVYKN